MIVRNITKADYDYLWPRVDAWWGHPITHLLHAVFLYHFGDTSFVAEQDGRVIGVLLGFISQKQIGEAYIHMVVVDPQARRSGVGRELYERFFAAARERGCSAVGSVTTTDNKRSVAFHTRLGFQMLREGALELDGIPFVPDHSGPGRGRVVLHRPL